MPPKRRPARKRESHFDAGRANWEAGECRTDLGGLPAHQIASVGSGRAPAWSEEVAGAAAAHPVQVDLRVTTGVLTLKWSRGSARQIFHQRIQIDKTFLSSFSVAHWSV
jgi:hypothetical protein